MHEFGLDSQTQAYLDGELSPGERAAFEVRLEADPELRLVIERWRGIESGLERVFSDEAGEAAPLKIDAVKQRPRAWASQRLKAAAAVVLLAGAAAVWGVQMLSPGPRGSPPRDALIYGVVTRAFRPAVVCDTPEKFVAYTREQIREPITADFAAAEAAGVTLVGWDTYGATYDPADRGTLPRILLATGPGGEEIVVYFKRRSHAAPTHVEGGPVRLFETELGSVRAFEISPLDRPVVLGLLGVED